MKKKVIISIIAFSLIIGGTVLTNAKPKSNLAKMWGNVLSKDYEKKESEQSPGILSEFAGYGNYLYFVCNET